MEPGASCSGFTQGIAQREAAGEPIPGMTAEALKDMAAIAQVDPEETDSREEAERRLDDVIEYIRFAAINIVNEAQSLQETDSEDLLKAEFARRRKNLTSMMGRPHSIAIVPGAREVTRSRDTEYPFRQNSDLFYLTGLRSLMQYWCCAWPAPRSGGAVLP